MSDRRIGNTPSVIAVAVVAVALVAAVAIALARKSVRDEVDHFGQSREALARVVRRTESSQ